jgi:hypothetical protein
MDRSAVDIGERSAAYRQAAWRSFDVNAAPYDDCAILLEGGEGPARVKACDMGRSIGLLQSAKGALPSPPAP